MGASLDSCDDRHAYVGYVFQSLNAFFVTLSPTAGIGDIAERGPIDIGNNLPTCAREDYDLVRPILRNPVEGLDKFRVSLRAHNERPAVVVELSNQYTLVISRQFQVVISSEVVTLKLHRFLLSVLLWLRCYCEVSTLPSGGYNETACGANDLSGNPGCLV